MPEADKPLQSEQTDSKVKPPNRHGDKDMLSVLMVATGPIYPAGMTCCFDSARALQSLLEPPMATLMPIGHRSLGGPGVLRGHIHVPGGKVLRDRPPDGQDIRQLTGTEGAGVAILQGRNARMHAGV